MVKAWTRHKTTEAVLNNGWRLAAVGGGWWLAVGGRWWLVAVTGGRLAICGGGRLVAVSGWRLVAVGGWRRLAVGGGRLAVGGWWPGLSLTKIKKESSRTALLYRGSQGRPALRSMYFA